jgi:hypothetical protein
MKRTSLLLFFSLVATVLAPAARTAGGPDVTDTRLLTQPAVSQRHVAFIIEELKKNPQAKPTRPPYPIKTLRRSSS